MGQPCNFYPCGSPVLWIAEARGEFGSEIAAAELPNGNVVAFIRPHYSPYMIEALSTSEGASAGLGKGRISSSFMGLANLGLETGIFDDLLYRVLLLGVILG